MTDRVKLEYEAQQSGTFLQNVIQSTVDGIVVVEYLERVHGVKLKVRQAQRYIRRLGFSLRQPIYQYAQATAEGVEEFGRTLKKTPSGKEK